MKAKKLTSDELRQSYLDFFADKGHRIVPSSSLVPHGDYTLLLTSAGMVQFKPYFTGAKEPPCARLTSCQKCFRTTDINLVGDSRHLTFFEMLGNFSIGDYFKKEAIAWAWEFVTERLTLPKERLWITIYLDDDEAFNYWKEIGIPEEKILRFGDEDNFWGPAGDSGPCGPCTEIHYDMGEEFGCGRDDCGPNCECGRFCEIWNLVFTQYNQDIHGERTPLRKPNIDTGMGLERTLAAIQGKGSPYETDSFSPLVEYVCRLSGKKYGEVADTDRAIRIVAEHGRGIVFLVADGVLPANGGRGYVLRRILRRASVFGRRLGLNSPFLADFAEVVIDQMMHVYPELSDNHDLIMQVVGAEENRFATTIEAGLAQVEELMADAIDRKRSYLKGGDVFRLYDTYGFPLELTSEIAREQGISVDMEGFNSAMEEQRERARAAMKLGSGVDDYVPPSAMKNGIVATEFTGYEKDVCRSRIFDIRVAGQRATSASQGEDIDIILARTPFYAEMGGQVGDTGEIRSKEGRVAVSNVIKSASDVIVHRGSVIEGNISNDDEVEARIDISRRLDIARNHTATHLLQAVLREVLGSHVQQRGSLVDSEKLRFDFSQMQPLTQSEIREVQRKVNEIIRRNLEVAARVISYDEAMSEGATALFEEKYGDMVRMIEIGQPAISRELCGGTHVKSTGELGIFLVVSASSIGTGLYRIEAVTGCGAELMMERRFSDLAGIAGDVEVPLEEAAGRVRVLMDDLEKERRRSLLLERELSCRITERLIEQAEDVDGAKLLLVEVPPLTPTVLREMGDVLRNKLGSSVIVLVVAQDGRPGFLSMVTQDLVGKGIHAGDLIKQMTKVTGGGGGGKASMAQGGGRDLSMVGEALKLARGIVMERLSSR